MTQNLPIQNTVTPREERRPTIFISYCREDKERIDRLIADLTAAGFTCWIDTESIPGGEDWMMAIAEGIVNSFAVVPVVTSNTLTSQFVLKEIVWAQRKKKRIIPWVLDNVMDDYFPLVNYQGVTVFDSEYDRALSKLLKCLPQPSELPQDSVGNGANSGDKARAAELAYMDRLLLEELINTDKYTTLAGSFQQQFKRPEMRAVFELVQFGKDREMQQETRRFENAVEEILEIRRAVLLGEPGGGKTTTIWKLAAELVADAVQDRQAPIPLLVRLGQWTDAEQPLPKFIASQLGDLGAYLDVLLREKRAALLLDGLNEMPAGQHKDKYAQVQKFIEQHPKLLAIVSCRELDYTIDLEFDRINITPLDPIRIREFAVRYLEEEKGESLFWRLAGGDEVRSVWEAWQKAGASFDLFWNAPEIPKQSPDVYNKTTSEHDRIWQEKVRGKHSLMVLARNPYMLSMLARVYDDEGKLPENRGELFRLFVEQLLKRERISRPEAEQAALAIEHDELIEKLARVAYEMQIRRANDQTGDALTVLARNEASAILTERQLYLAGSASILSVGEQVRFTHQLLQEYFAAKFMDIEIHAERLKAVEIWKPDRWWERTNWEEAAILLAGLYSDDCSKVAEWIAEANPEIAAQCATRSGASLAESTKEKFRAKWIPRLTDLKSDSNPKARAAVGRAIGLIGGDHRKGVGVVDGLPDIDWVRIPEGEFQYGEKLQKLTLPTFWISRFPVTYRQFQSFVEDSEGLSDPRWFEGLAASDEEHQAGDQAFKFDNHPRERVSWYQAMAFCRWLSWRLGGKYDLKKVADWEVRLPTEFEWEKAARGTDGRLYPYKGEYDPKKGNTEQIIGQTSAVGIFPNGASPYGVEEMSGNVWEWCLTDYNAPKTDAAEENLRTKDSRVLRGGSWINVPSSARAVYRYDIHPALRNVNFGFRVVCCRPPSSS